MPRLSIEQRIAQLEARKQALKARFNTQERARDTRGKILLGALVLDALERDRSGLGETADRNFAAVLEGWIAADLPAFLTRPVDRTLFPGFIRTDTDQAAGSTVSEEAETGTGLLPAS